MHGIGRLDHFLAVVTAGSVQAAARTLNISQPALSRSIRLLEQSLDTILFERSTKGITLTSAGTAFLAKSREIAQTWDESLIELNAITSGAAGSLRIGMGPTYALLVAPQVVEGLTRRFPNMVVSFEIGVASQLLSQVESGQLALYLGAIDEIPMQNVDHVVQVELSAHRNVLVASRDLVLPEDRLDRLKLLGQMRWIGLTYDQRLRDAVRQLFVGADLPVPSFSINTHSLRMALDLAAQPGFVTGIPEPILRHHDTGRIRQLEVAGYDWKVRTGITYRRSLERLEPFRWLKSALMA
ncbi:LysR family transcriptional regulator [Pseudooceanicola sp. 216_PA32_1]|uniref:LysR family transcriptional regulator n=1 Tax=Pseudooceanicola pacificus TaxID=2676438 RepID=A0A844W4K2_9RHOB|nr:LysR family transcriptional regulator [Pseudooceanicola pacificus]MWB77995.1 LysR family transcriptional regulator [Pseudooceanicola pacificus]